jgi:apolipoprotein N-acyltransferase
MKEPTMTWTLQHTINLALALAAGLALHVSFGLQPVWWLAWLAPAPLLVAVLRSTARGAFGLALLAGLIAASADLRFFAVAAPLPVALWITVLLALAWVLVVGLARRVMLRMASPWAVLAYPLLWAGVDTVLAHVHPDGNWGSLAYAQAGFLPAVQIVALTGVAGVVFLLALVPSVLALAYVRGWRALRVPAVCTLVLVGASFTYGWQRTHAPAAPPGAPVGLAVIDDFIGPRTPTAYNERIWAQYERHVTALAGQGARIVLLPEKIAVLAPADADRIAQRLALLARRNGVWLAAGIGIDDGRSKRNLEWLFAPDGRRDASYQKHHMAPPERDFAPGAAFDLRTIAGTRYGLAICKDLHFAEMGRAYGARGAAAMLVPAWDFGLDGQYAARLSALRGIESGFAMVRASREGLLTVTDALGRITAETPSAPLPGATLLAHVPLGGPAATLYARTGDVFGWLCLGGALLQLVLAYRRASRRAADARPASAAA